MYQFIDGERRRGTSSTTIDLVDPSCGEAYDAIQLASHNDVEAAVQAARRAFGGWSGTTPGERAEILARISAGVGEPAPRSSREAESRQAGKPIRLAREFDVPGTVDNVAFFAGAARHLEGTASGRVLRATTPARSAGSRSASSAPSPRGTTPCRWPGGRSCPAIAAGNTIVLKPAEITPVTRSCWPRRATEAGLPAGVLNVVTGTRPGGRRAPGGHPDVDMVSFTGSTAVGKQRHGHRSRATGSGCTWSSVARRRSSSSTTPTSRPQSTAPSRRRSSTPARTAPPPPGPTCTARCTTRSSQGVAELMGRSRSARPATRRPTSAR